MVGPVECRGRIVDERGTPHEGLVVAVEDARTGPRVRLAQAVTDAAGAYALSARADAWDAPEGCALAVYDILGLRPLLRVPLAADATSGLIEPIAVPRALAHGWAATRMADPRPVRLSEGNDLAFFPDDEMWREIARAVRGARRTLVVTQLLFEPDFAISQDYGDRTRLLDMVLDAGRRGVEARILLNDNAVIRDSCAALEKAVAAAGVPNVRLRRFPTSPNVLHSKLLVVDAQEAFIVGPPFQQRYWDTPAHRTHEERRGHPQPLHDVTVRLRGPIVADVHEGACWLYNRRAEEGTEGANAEFDILPPISPPPRAGEATLQFVQTIPPATLPQVPHGETTILQAYLRGIAAARDFVYIETQYYTSPTIAEALTRALRRNPALEVIIVLNESTDIPTYVRWQKHRLKEMGHPAEPRLGVFTLRSPGAIYVHSKVALADDAWATVGTANLDSMSLETADEFAAPIEPNIDANIVVLDGVDGAPRVGAVASLRRRLFAEHLGDAPEAYATRPEGGWLAVWRRVAEENRARLVDGRPMRGQAVPYEP